METTSELTVVDELERATRAQVLRKQGHTWADVAEQTGYANAEVARLGVHRALKRASLNLSQQRLDEILAVEMLELQELQDAAWPAAMMGDPKAIDSVLKVKDRVYKLLGFDKRDEKVTNQTLIVPADRFVETLQEAIEKRDAREDAY